MRFGNAIGRCVRGAAHIRSGKPCQDALKITQTPRYIIASLADGHGSPRCPYSGEGAQSAVEVSHSVLASVLEGKTAEEAFRVFEANKDIHLPKQIEREWKVAVADIHEKSGRETPFGYELYGATLLTLVRAEGFLFALQLGDGDILSIDGEGETAVRVIPALEQFGADTDSLCQDDCWQYMRARLLPEPAGAGMFLLATDGYANSFCDDAGFLKVGLDMYALLREHGAGYIEERLEGWLEMSSENGSGDDITAALIY
jgi:serine/threonine protein phosphatase PrpC